MYLRAARSMAAFAGMCDGGPTDACVTGNIQNIELKIELFFKLLKSNTVKTAYMPLTVQIVF